MQYRGGTVACHHSNHDPTHSLQRLQPPNVFAILGQVTPVVLTVILDGHHVVAPTHVQVVRPMFGYHHYLSLRPRKSAFDEK